MGLEYLVVLRTLFLAMKSRILFVLPVLCVATCQLISKEDYPSDWINPADMMNFVPVRTAVEKRTEAKDQQDDPTTAKSDETCSDDSCADDASPVDGDAVDNKIGAADQRVNGGNDYVGGDEVPKSQNAECKNAMLRRYVLVLIAHLKNVVEPRSTKHYDMSLTIDGRAWSALQEYASDCRRNVNEIVELLENMIGDVRVHVVDKRPWKLRLEDYIRVPLDQVVQVAFAILAIVSALSMEFLSRVPWVSQLKRLLILGFIVSLCMTYYQELKSAEAEFKTKSSKLPEECFQDSGELSYASTLKAMYNHWFSVKSQDDRCKEFHEAFLINPILKVTPTKVLAVTMTRFALEPMEHMGTSFSKAFKNIFAGLPVTLWIPAFLFVVLVILGVMLIIAVLFGYNFSINLPFWAGLQMAPPQMIAQDPAAEQLRNENDRLQNTIEDLRAQRQALPAPLQNPEDIRQRDYNQPTPQYPENDRQRDYQPPPPRYTGANLPYPDVTAAGDASSSRTDPHHAGLRRRHTCNAGFGTAADNPTLPYPDDLNPVGGPARSTSDPPQPGRGIGFEPLQDAAEAQLDDGNRDHQTGDSADTNFGKTSVPVNQHQDPPQKAFCSPENSQDGIGNGVASTEFLVDAGCSNGGTGVDGGSNPSSGTSDAFHEAPDAFEEYVREAASGFSCTG